MSRVLAAALAGICLLLLGAASAGAEPIGSPFRFSSTPVPDLALGSLGPSSALAAWAPTSRFASTRRLGLAAAAGPVQSVPGGGPGSVASNPRLGQYLRVWSDLRGKDGYGSGLSATILDANGMPLADKTVLVPPFFAGGVYGPAASYNPTTRRYIVVYGTSIDGPGPGWGGCIVDEQGRLVSALPGRNLAFAPHVRIRSDGSAIVVWQEYRFTDHGADLVIMGELVSRAGVAGNPFEISDHRNLVGEVQNVDPRVAVDPVSNRALVVWSDQYEVFARRIGADGRPFGGDLWLSRMGPPSDPAWLTRSPDVAYNTQARQYLVTWQSGPGKATYPIGERIYGQHLDREAEQIGANDFLISPEDRAERPRVIPLRGGPDFLVAWGDPTGVARRVGATSGGRPARLPERAATPDRPPVHRPSVPFPPVSPGH
jgi:hypothetical protein